MGLFPRSVILAVLSISSAAAHNALLPRPQHIEYGAGRFALERAVISLPASAAPEDQFAAAELGRWLGLPVRPGAKGHAVRMERTGSLPAMPQADEKPGPDSRESYKIAIKPDSVVIAAPSSAGLYYAAQTLRQMVEDKSLPEARIHDWPDLAYRGFMMDLSHGELLTEAEIERQIEFLARFKTNQYYFYSELTIELKGYGIVNRNARYSQEQVRRIIDYARLRHVDVVPCLEYYGHLHDLFRVERYADMGALPHGGEINPRHPRTRKFLEDAIGQMAALFPSPWFHAGLDEPFELEVAGAQAAGGVEPSVLYGEHLGTVASLVQQRGKRMLFWADMAIGAAIFTKYPALLEKLPAGSVPVPWYYYPKDDYSPWAKPFADRRIAPVMAPAILCWHEVYPDYTITFPNIDGMLAAGRKYGAIGAVNTGWTDDAQTIYRMMLPGMAYGAVAEWQTAPVERDRFFADYASIVYPPAASTAVAGALDKLRTAQDRFDAAFGQPGRGHTMYAFWEDPLDPAQLERAAAHREDLRQCRLAAEDAQDLIDEAYSSDPDSLESLMLGARMLDYVAQKYLYAVQFADYFKRMGSHPKKEEVQTLVSIEIADADHGLLADLMDGITGLRKAYRAAWLRESTDYRMDTALGRWDAEYEYWRRLQRNMFRAGSAWTEGASLPSLDSLRPK